MRSRNVRVFNQQIILGLLVFVFSSAVAYGATYYVRTDGNDANNGLANTAADAWRTIDWAADHVAAGDVVRVQTGTYVETATPSVSGAAGNTVTLVADGAVTTCGMTFSGKSYIRVIGFTMDGNTSGCTVSQPRIWLGGTNTGLEFWNNDLDNSSHSFLVNDPADRCNACIIFGGSIRHVNNNTHGITITGDDNFIGYVGFDQINYLGVVPSGHRMRFVNLNFSNFIQNGPLVHPDFFYPQGGNAFGYSNNLIESVYGIGTTTSRDNKAMHFQNQTATDWNDNIWRQSVIYDMGAGFYSVYSDNAAIARLRFYNNTHVNCARANNDYTNDSCGNLEVRNGNSISASIYNNIFYQAWADAVSSPVVWAESNSPTITKDYNLAYSPLAAMTFRSNWTGQEHERSNVNPSLVSTSSGFTLQSGSGARGAGGPLTTASGSGSSSTRLTVAANTGSFFVGSNASNLPQYGGALVPGDVITVGSTTVQVSSVSGDTITLASPISWTSGAPVYFGSSATIDIGAYPYKSGGYALSAGYDCSAGTCTIEPSDASLVRFVVCYNGGVPYAVDNVTPYTCADPAGAFSARAYPRYASKTLWTTASSAGFPPGNLRIVP